jgi:hypothetical protein
MRRHKNLSTITLVPRLGLLEVQNRVMPKLAIYEGTNDKFHIFITPR